jgi:glycosyltransferase involved in cell wall biosynthesis
MRRSILFISPSLTRRAGGIFTVGKSLACHLTATAGISVEAIGLDEQANRADLEEWHPVRASVFPFIGPASFGYSPQLRSRLDHSTHDLAHLQALWMYPSIATRHWARRHRKPYVVTPNGMLEPWALRNSRWKKRLAAFFYENRTLHDAACLQANTTKELNDIRAFGLRNPVAIVPNGIDLPDLEESWEQEEGNREQSTNKGKYRKAQSPTSDFRTPKSGSKVLLFLARIHPKKELAELLEAWSSLRSRWADWRLEIVGWDDGGHEIGLRAKCHWLGLDSSVSWPGPQFGKQFPAAYQRASAFILPSFSEGLPMAVLAAWAYGKPVLMTRQCNLPEGFTAQAALEIAPSVDSIAEGITRIMEMPDEELAAMGRRGRRLVEEQFTWPQVAATVLSVYEWVLGSGPKPECVVM